MGASHKLRAINRVLIVLLNLSLTACSTAAPIPISSATPGRTTPTLKPQGLPTVARATRDLRDNAIQRPGPRPPTIVPVTAPDPVPTNPPTLATAAVTSTPDPASASNGAAHALRQAAANMRELKSFHMDTTVAAAGHIATQAFDIDVQKQQLRLEARGPGEQVNIIVIGNRSWTSTDGAKTYRTDPAQESKAEGFKPLINEWRTSDITGQATVPSAIKTGTPPTEVIDGVATNHYVIDNKDFAGVGLVTAGTVEFWITPGSNPTVRQEKTTIFVGGVATLSTTKWSKFNEDFAISVPK
jgi:hypothetical protein